MNIIQKQPNPSGAYPPMQSWSGETTPDTHYIITADTTDFCTWSGFIVPTIENDVVTSYVCNTEAWEAWKTVPIETVRADKLKSLDGMCSGAIYQGVDIGTLHYNFTEKTQVNLETIARLIKEGQNKFLYRADNEPEQRIYTVDEMKAIITAKSEWIAVNTNYYELLKKWVNREEDAEVIKGIEYGSKLPDDLMAELATKLASVGIDITKYAAMLGGAK